MRCKIVFDKLKPGLSYPCSARELRHYLRYVPSKDASLVHSIRVTGSTKYRYEDGNIVRRGYGYRIVLAYAVNSELVREFCAQSRPGAGNIAEWEYFGGTFCDADGNYSVAWEDLDHLKRYVRFILFHEVGHKVFGLRPGPTRAEEEKFADSYAYCHLDREPSSA